MSRAHDRYDDSFLREGGKTIRLHGWQAVLTIPYWSLAAATGWSLVPAGLALRNRMRRRRRVLAGLCPACGYDLRATPGRCPECGSAK